MPLLSLKARIGRLVTRRSALLAPKPALRRAPTPVVSPARPHRAARSTSARRSGRRRRGRGDEAAPAPRARPRASEARQALERRLSACPSWRCWRCRSRPTASRRARNRSRRPPRRSKACCGDFGVRGEIINARPGPVVTLYELEPAPGIKSSRVIGLADDIARSMSALSARVAVVSGRNAIGIELPNDKREKVYLRELLGVRRLHRARRRSCRSASARPSAASR